MSSTAVVRRDVEVLTFDVFGTLLDWNTAMFPALAEYFDAKGVDSAPRRAFQDYLDRFFVSSLINSVSAAPFESWWDLSSTALAEQLREEGADPTEEEVLDLLTTGWGGSGPHPEVEAGLDRLAEEYTLVAFSMCDPELLRDCVDPTRANDFGFEFDAVVSTGITGEWKPHPDTYAIARDRHDVPPRKIMHVAAHGWDIVGPKSTGLRACFVDRAEGKMWAEEAPGSLLGYEPDLVVRDIEELADVLVA